MGHQAQGHVGQHIIWSLMLWLCLRKGSDWFIVQTLHNHFSWTHTWEVARRLVWTMCPYHDFAQAMHGRKGGGEPILDPAASHFHSDHRQGAALQFIVRLGWWTFGRMEREMECGIVESLFTVPWDLIGSHQPRQSSGSQSDLFALQWHCCTGGTSPDREIARHGYEHCRWFLKTSIVLYAFCRCGGAAFVPFPGSELLWPVMLLTSHNLPIHISLSRFRINKVFFSNLFIHPVV